MGSHRRLELLAGDEALGRVGLSFLKGRGHDPENQTSLHSREWIHIHRPYGKGSQDSEVDWGGVNSGGVKFEFILNHLILWPYSSSSLGKLSGLIHQHVLSPIYLYL